MSHRSSGKRRSTSRSSSSGSIAVVWCASTCRTRSSGITSWSTCSRATCPTSPPRRSIPITTKGQRSDFRARRHQRIAGSGSRRPAPDPMRGGHSWRSPRINERMAQARAKHRPSARNPLGRCQAELFPDFDYRTCKCGEKAELSTLSPYPSSRRERGCVAHELSLSPRGDGCDVARGRGVDLRSWNAADLRVTIGSDRQRRETNHATKGIWAKRDKAIRADKVGPGRGAAALRYWMR